MFQVLAQFEGPQVPKCWSKWAGSPNVPPSLFPDSQVIPEWLVLQYSLGPSVFPDPRVISERLFLQYFRIHEPYWNDWSFTRFTPTTKTKRKSKEKKKNLEVQNLHENAKGKSDEPRLEDKTFCIDSMNGKWVIITGAGRGIGRAIALDFARRQAKLVLVSRSEGKSFT